MTEYDTKTNISAKEKIIYEISSRISSSDAPIVFKGALITKLILAENGYTDVVRGTKDIDANWYGNPPSTELIRKEIQNALDGMTDSYYVEVSREYGENRSAGLVVYHKDTKQKVISMDIDILKLTGCRDYYYGEAVIRGVNVDEILADKLLCISSDLVYKHRTKDLIDVYALMHCVSIDINDIYNTIQNHNRTIGTFDGFLNKTNELQHAYDMLRGIERKPNFEKIYCEVKSFLEPFIYRKTDMLWDANQKGWIENIEPKPNKNETDYLDLTNPNVSKTI